MARIKCGRCGTEFEPPQSTLTGTPECVCPMCGYSKKDVQEANKSNQKVLKG